MSGMPTAIGKYQIIREIARSNDIVYEAYDPLMNRRVALKELAMPSGASGTQKDDRIKRFLREAKAAGSLAHPNIVTIYEVGVEGDRHFLAMEFLDGHTLRNEVDTQGVLPPARAVEIACAVLKGLDYAHKNGVIHRDIKPDNIQLLTDGRIKLTDFGIARLTFEPNITIDGQIFGTPSYMSPEQVVGKEIDVRSDLFSVGVVLYEMLAGRKPFAGDSVVSITYAIMNKEPDRLDQIPWPLWQVIERSLDKSPSQRYANADEMIEALERALNAAQHPVMDMNPAPYPQPVNPYAPPVLTSPPTYAFNPYQPPPPLPQQQQQQMQIVNGPNGQPTIQIGNLQVPMYYPRPPRGPLFKPETKVFLTRLFVTLIVLGSLFGLVLVGVNAMSTALGRYQLQERDRIKRERFLKDDTSLTLNQRIAAGEELIRGLQSEPARAEERRNLAVLYERLGNQRVIERKNAEAERAFRQAADYDPMNAAYASDLANLYAKNAAEQQGAQRVAMLGASADEWERAVQQERDEQRRRKYASGAAVTLYQYATAVAPIDPGTARLKLYKAREFALPNSNLAGDIQFLLDSLTR